MGHLKLTKVQILAHKLSVKPLLEEVQKYGSFHTVNAKELHEGTVRHSSGELYSARDRQNKLNKALKLLEPFREKGNLLDELLPIKEELSEEQAESLIGNAKPEFVVEKILKLEEDRTHNEKEIGNLQSQIEGLIPWKQFQFNRSAFSRTRRVRIETGSIPSQNIESLRLALSKCDDFWELETIPTNSKESDQTPVLFIFLAAEAPVYIPLLNEAGFQEFRLPERFTPAKEIIRQQEQISKLKIEIKQCSNAIADKARYVKALRLALDNVTCEIARLEKENEAIATRTTVVVEGWIPLDDFPNLKHKLERFGTVYIEKIDKAEGEEAPVVLTNSRFATPFEVVTELYATPRGEEYDPTPFLAPFFALYFGVCLTDAGYGLVLLIACMLLIKRLRPSGGTKKLLTTLGICGFSTVILGFLTGGFFGITSSSDAAKAAFPKLTAFMVSMQKSAIGFDPMTDTMFFFKLVLVFGVIHVAFGYMIKAWWNVKNNKAADAVYDQGSWLLIIIGAIFLALNSLGFLPYAAAKTIGIIFMIAGSLLVLFYAGRENEGIIGRIGGGLFELYGITGLFGDVLSYARLLALGMATGVIAGVINTIAFMVLDIPFGLGYLLFVIIFVLGHLSNIAINTMGAFVHTLRLQFVEFFTKFYEGGGEPFSPLTEERDYTFIRERKTQP